MALFSSNLANFLLGVFFLATFLLIFRGIRIQFTKRKLLKRNKLQWGEFSILGNEKSLKLQQDNRDHPLYNNSEECIKLIANLVEQDQNFRKALGKSYESGEIKVFIEKILGGLSQDPKEYDLDYVCYAIRKNPYNRPALNSSNRISLYRRQS